MTLAKDYKIGLAIISTFGIFNCISCLSVLSIIIYHRYYKKWRVFQSQNITLITNLLLSDVIQSFGFISDLEWIARDEIGTNEKTCTAQGIFIQLGDSATALFVILIAGHTLKHFLTPTNPSLHPKAFRAVIATAWVFCFLMAIIPRALHRDFYANAGVWCWISSKYIWSRLYLHYAYLFLAEFVSIMIYGGLGIYLWIYQSKAKSKEMQRVAKTMFAYPIAYTFGTLPLATLRARVMAHHEVSKRAVIVACIIFSMLGSINCAVYVLTRRKMMMRERADRTGSGRGSDDYLSKVKTGSPSADEDDFEIEMPKDIKYDVTVSSSKLGSLDSDISIHPVIPSPVSLTDV